MLTQFNKLNEIRKRTFLMTQFTFALYLAFIFSIILSLRDRLIYTCFRTIVLTRSQESVLRILCAE